MAENRNSDFEAFKPGPGILSRVQNVKTTLRGFVVSTLTINHILTFDELDNIISKRSSNPNHRSIFMQSPFNELSLVNDCIAITGLAGLNQENIISTLGQNYQLGCIMNVTYEVPLFKPNGIEAYRVPVTDDCKEDISIFFDEVTAKLDEYRTKNQVTIVHCMAGVSRSATIVIAYLIRYENYSLERAFQHLKQLRSVIRPNLNFLAQLSEYEVQLHGEENRSEWISHTINGITRYVPKFIIDTCLVQYLFEFTPERSGSRRSSSSSTLPLGSNDQSTQTSKDNH
ncbi:hypothetical protein RDWZM_006451 [Blomia tropicalis]|uniref:Uncharacterized protein n=1 Tax=Blomia tropicalis TaxID=40697 RepID=A0A9Q0M884_BLOTA|nr:hypothetical protein RDWZM_006451 [Blomia tropicalis]